MKRQVLCVSFAVRDTDINLAKCWPFILSHGNLHYPKTCLSFFLKIDYYRRCQVEDAEKSVRKTMGYSTVSHFNLVHVDCHLAAVRQARARDEWESAALQNANTKCNGLLPLWGPGE